MYFACEDILQRPYKVSRRSNNTLDSNIVQRPIPGHNIVDIVVYCDNL